MYRILKIMWQNVINSYQKQNFFFKLLRKVKANPPDVDDPMVQQLRFVVNFNGTYDCIILLILVSRT